MYDLPCVSVMGIVKQVDRLSIN